MKKSIPHLQNARTLARLDQLLARLSHRCTQRVRRSAENSTNARSRRAPRRDARTRTGRAAPCASSILRAPKRGASVSTPHSARTRAARQRAAHSQPRPIAFHSRRRPRRQNNRKEARLPDDVVRQTQRPRARACKSRKARTPLRSAAPHFRQSSADRAAPQTQALGAEAPRLRRRQAHRHAEAAATSTRSDFSRTRRICSRARSAGIQFKLTANDPKQNHRRVP
jgi:hypothetical protein